MKLRWLALVLASGLALPFIVPALAADRSVTVSNNSFSPRDVAVMPGDTVTWEKAGTGISHNIVWEDGHETQPSSGLYSAPWTATRTFDTAGEYSYYCDFHGSANGTGMAGTVYVNAAGTVPASTTPTNTAPTNTSPTNTTPTNTTGTGTSTTGTTPGDTSRPSITELEPAASGFCRHRSRSCRRPGIRFSLELSEAATLDGVVTRTGKLRRAARRRSFQRSGRQGLNNVRVSARGLAKGRYRLRVTARDAAGNVSEAGVARFTLR